MATDQALLDAVYQQYLQNKLVAVPGKPGRVYWPVTILKRSRDKATGKSESSRQLVGLKETTEDRAKRWLVIKEAGEGARRKLSQIASLEQPTESEQTTQILESAEQAMENPMYEDDDFFRYQYSKSPYGAEQSIPASRRNPVQRVRYTPGADLTGGQRFGQIAARARQILEEKPECKWGDAFRQAREELGLTGYGKKKKKVAAPNPAMENPEHVWRAHFGRIGKRAYDILQAKPECSWQTAWKQATADIEGGKRVEVYKHRKADKAGQVARQQMAKRAMELYHGGKAPSLQAGWAIVKGESAAASAVAPQDLMQYGLHLGLDRAEVKKVLDKCAQFTSDVWDHDDTRAVLEKKAREKKARTNPWYEDGLYLPDTTQVFSSLVPSGRNWSDSTQVFSALEGGRYGRKNPYNETPYLEGPQTAGATQGHHPIYGQFIGQFGTGEAWTHGVVPYGRRNGKGGRGR